MPRPTPRPSRTVAPSSSRSGRVRRSSITVTTGPISDAIERLQAGHREILALLARGPRALGPLTEALRRHAEEEQEVFHPALRRAAGRTVAGVTESVRQHRGIERLLADLQGLPTGPGRRQRFEELRARIEEHFRDTESSVFPEALRKLSRPERLALGERMDLLGQSR